jgi:isocitrate/isopropylmalate dehydrogenase
MQRKEQQMAKHKIAVLPGDGVGIEVIEAANIVLDEIALDAEYLHGDIGWEFWCTEGDPLPERTIELLKNTDCCLFGAITSKPKEESEKELAAELRGKGLAYYSPIVGLRQMFNLYANLRPARAYPGNPLNYRDDIDIVIFRENTEGLYSGVEFFPLPEGIKQALLQHHKKMAKFKDVPADEIALSCRLFTVEGCRRIVRKAFEYARKKNRPTVTVVEKPNVLRETSGLMVRTARQIQKEYPEIELWETNVDAMCMWLVKNPQDYSVLVSSNMFGDIVSDLCGQLVGGLGFTAGANIGDEYAVFEPVHGSAPKYFGQYKVNPTATIQCVRLMLEYLGEEEKARRLERAIAAHIKENKIKTYDVGGTSTTLEVARSIARFYRGS